MAKDLTQIQTEEEGDNKSISLPTTPLLSKLKEKKMQKAKEKSSSVLENARKRRKKSAKIQNLAPHIDFLPMESGIIISKLDYILTEEREDVYVFEKTKLAKQKKVEDAKYNIKNRIKSKLQTKIGE